MPSVSRKMIAASVAAVVAAALVALYAAVDPAEAVWMPKCMVWQLTGFRCPGCGSQRMVHALLHGDLHSAFACNAFLMLMLPVIALMIWLEASRKRHPALYSALYGKWGCALILGSILLWTVLRNIFGI